MVSGSHFLPAAAGVVREMDAGLRGDVGEAQPAVPRGSSCDCSGADLQASKTTQAQAFVIVNRLSLIVILGA